MIADSSEVIFDCVLDEAQHCVALLLEAGN